VTLVDENIIGPKLKFFYHLLKASMKGIEGNTHTISDRFAGSSGFVECK
jgi:hypothetical protein